MFSSHRNIGIAREVVKAGQSAEKKSEEPKTAGEAIRRGKSGQANAKLLQAGIIPSPHKALISFPAEC